jgi:hypothetical protein
MSAVIKDAEVLVVGGGAAAWSERPPVKPVKISLIARDYTGGDGK